MAGVYIHIPYCRRKCNYCNFYSTPASFNAAEFVDLLIAEAKLRSDFFEGQTLNTIYLGGGSPGLFPVKQSERLIEAISATFPFSPEPEITIELNPDDVTANLIKDLKSTAINRISIGIQSFSNEALNYLERIHNGEQAYNAISSIKNNGYENVSADIIYGIPEIGLDVLYSDIKKLIDLQIPHISAYNLTIEPSTRLEKQITMNQRRDIVSEEGAEALSHLISLLESHAYLHYEISNFCLPGCFSKHNTSYWQGEKYLGLGPSAHSYNGKARSWNPASIKKYSDGISNGNCHIETEMLSKNDRYNEFVMTSLRTMWGCNSRIIEQQFGIDYKNYCLKQAQVWLQEKKIILKDEILYLSSTGKLFADGIAASMFRI